MAMPMLVPIGSPDSVPSIATCSASSTDSATRPAVAGFLARPQIADRNGPMRLAAEIDQALDGLDRYFRTGSIEQDSFDQLVLALEQPHTRVRIGQILLQSRAHDAVSGGEPDESYEVV